MVKRTAEGHLLKDDLSNYDKNVYEKPAATIDVAICSIVHDDLKVLLIKRKHPPFRNSWAIPGGFVDLPAKETIEETAARELKEETGLDGIYFEQLKTYGDPDRDPRMRVITVAYFALVNLTFDQMVNIEAGDDAKEAKWFSLRNLPKLAFDHKRILTDLRQRLEGKISYTPIAFHLVGTEFTWSELQNVYEIVLGRSLIAPNFRRKIKAQYYIKELNQKRKDTTGRPSTLLMWIGTKEEFN